ncbi:hypothetical protein ACPA9J_23005 [Pseudomonas aeruginosa]
MKLRRNPERGAGLPPLLLHGQQLERLALELDGQALRRRTTTNWTTSDSGCNRGRPNSSSGARCVSIRRATPRWKAAQVRQDVLHQCEAEVSARSPITSTVPT